ncbi:uncharacterized protein LOC128671484 isoform X12 [Plodia interpunctella]|uniref:uncharacterized protein LOC128671484 isoform X12 n=1 Tax=Plodia interpunctella TaxID=58824 RepID=UPI002367FE80|nr:uncharacterized protein LOC128671484 isoform X11 [Plodia interpunctella]
MSAREVELSGGAPWGFRMHGGADHNQPLRISRVNPGRKASLSGIREGDVISSINGRPTKAMSNAEAHAMLRAAGPVLRLGLNEDRETSPRRRSIGKTTELKRPSQLIAEQSGRATPQAPVYATIRPSNSSLNRLPSTRSSLNSIPIALNSTPLVKSVVSMEEPIRFHPTNPFYTTLPSNYTSASKLPLPNGKPTFHNLDRNKLRENTYNNYSDLKSPSLFSNTFDSGPSSLPNTTEYINGYEKSAKSINNDYTHPFYNSKLNQNTDQGLPNSVNDSGKNPFETKRNSDPFEKYLRKENINEKYESTMPSSFSDTNFQKKEEIMKHTITEHKISEIEEVKTIKKFILNGSNDTKEGYQVENINYSSPGNKVNILGTHNTLNGNLDHRENEPQFSAPSDPNYHFDKSEYRRDEEQRSTYRPMFEDYRNTQPAEASSCDVVTNKPPPKSPSAVPVNTPTPKRTTANIDSQHRIIDQPLPLRDLCVKKISNLPYGLKILEELASVSERLQNINVYGLTSKEKERASKKENLKEKNMPYYPLPDLSSIEKVSLPSKSYEPLAPPVQPRNSSLKKSQDDNHWTALPSKSDPVYVCFSPSQKMLMEKTNTVITKEDATELIDTHKKFVDRRGYNEYYRENNKGHEHVTESPVVPFKSQTGSRLLALIRDPTVSYNINSSMNDHHFRNQNFGNLDKKSYMMNNRTDISSTFKPIPPPRPKKYSSSFYESDESSDFTDSSFRSMKSERKYFHYSTGNLSKEIENDVSSIQNMHRNFTDIRDSFNGSNFPRRPSLPKDICDKQMEYIRQKEKEVEAEIKRLEEEKNSMPVAPQRGPRAPLIKDKHNMVEQQYLYNQYRVDSKNICNNIQVPEKPVRSRLKSLFSSSEEELLRDKMYSEYVNQMAERQERKQHRIIKITNTGGDSKAKTVSKSMSALDVLDSKVNNRIEKEFISKARERWDKLGIKDPETEDEIESSKDVYREPKVIEHKIKVIEGNKETDVKKLPSHLQDFVRFTAKDKDDGRSSSETVMIAPTFKARSTSPAVWRPGAPTPPPAAAPAPAPVARSPGAPPPPPPPVWTPGSAGPSPQSTRKTFRPVHFEETPPTRRKFGNSEHNGCTSESESERRLRTSQSAPATGLNSLGTTGSSRLPRAQNPTVTLLQKAREGQIPRGSSYLQQERDSARLPRDRPSPPIGDPVHALRLGYASEGEAEIGARKMADAHARSKVEGIGPTTKDGMPVALRSEVKDPSRWYKKMYDTIHKNKYDDDYVTIRYKSRRGEPPQRVSNKSQYAYFDPRSGYLSEPEGGGRLGSGAWSDAYDSDVTSGARRRTASVQDDRRISDTSSPYLPNNKYSTLASARASQEVYKNQPGRIEDYVPGRSSVIDKEAKQWWDEVMDIFDGWLDDNSPLPPYTTLLARAIQKSQNISSTTSLPQASPKEKKDITSAILSKSNMARALKESGYESDSTLVFRRRDESAALSPAERRAAYRDLQAGGEPPLRGFRSPAPQRQECDSAPEPPRRATQGIYADKESPRRYVESDVNIHYRCPVRHDPLPLVPERELARQQAEHMKRLYREQKRNKYLQENEIHPLDIEAFDASIKELQDMQNRRHQDNFTPSQKNILPLNRYDEADRFVARALYAFNGQTARELSFRKGDLINVRRQIDANWYEGEVHGKIGLFPYNYVELMKGELAQSPKKPTVIEGRARAKFDFTAQTNLELPLKKGEVVVLTRRIDQNWWEGRNGGKTGIFPDSYVTVLQEPSPNKPEPQPTLSNDKPVASPAAHGLLNGSAKRSMGAHSYMPQPNNPALSNAPPATQPLPGYVAKPAQVTATPSERGYGPPTTPGVDLNNTEPLYVDTNAEAVPYRAMYKYRPQNPDELELNEGDTVYVLEKCDDGWYVGSSQRTGRFGTFPGNYVERI